MTDQSDSDFIVQLIDNAFSSKKFKGSKRKPDSIRMTCVYPHGGKIFEFKFRKYL